MSHAATFAIVFALILICSTLALVMVRRRVQRRLFADLSTYDDWDQAQLQLTWREKLGVMRATAKQQKVDRPDLEQAQLAYVRYAKQVAERSPLLRRARLRLAFGVSYLLVAAAEIIFAIFDNSGHRAVSVAEAVIFALLAVLWFVAIPKSLQRRPRQLAQLLQRLDDGHVSS